MEDRFLQYTIEELLAEDSFVDWINKIPPYYNKWEEWLEKHPDQKLKVEQSSSLLQQFQFTENIDKESEDRVWANIQGEIAGSDTESGSVHKTRFLYKYIAYIAVAASIALIAYFGIFFDPLDKLTSSNANQIAYTLPDQSKILLNAGTVVRFDEEKFNVRRTLEIDGEAFFDVRKGAQFTIQTKAGKVEVLGTSFNVLARQNQFEVKVSSGRVKVSLNDGMAETILSKGDKLYTTDNKEFVVSKFLPENSSDWRQGAFSFNDKPLKFVFDEFERQFDVKIRASDKILSKKYTGFFKNSDLDSALYAICWPMKLSSSKENKAIYIVETE